MKRTLLVSFLLTVFLLSFSQENVLLFKKKTKTVQSFWKGSFIAFQTENGVWQKGEIKRLQNDSFYIQPMVVSYGWFGNDTLRYQTTGYSFSDVYALPKKGVLIDYKDGVFQIIKSAGHVHWYWIKSGWVFRTGAVGYAGLHTVNGIMDTRFSFAESKSTFGTVAGIYLFGYLLKKLYKPTLQLGKKYHLEILKLG